MKNQNFDINLNFCFFIYHSPSCKQIYPKIGVFKLRSSFNKIFRVFFKSRHFNPHMKFPMHSDFNAYTRFDFVEFSFFVIFHNYFSSSKHKNKSSLRLTPYSKSNLMTLLRRKNVQENVKIFSCANNKKYLIISLPAIFIMNESKKKTYTK